MANIKKSLLGNILLNKSIITQAQLDAAIAEHHANGKKLGEIFIEKGLIKEDELLNLIAEQLKIPFVDLKNYSFDPELVHLIPESYARRFRCLVLKKDNNGIMVGMADPQDVIAYDEILQKLQQPMQIALVREEDLKHILNVAYRHSAEISHLAEKLSIQIGESEYDISQLTTGISTDETPVARLLQTIFEDAAQVSASDIHIEPDEKVLRIRHRVDGMLHEQVLKEKNVSDALALRLKLMAHLNIAEKRIPQDGRFSIRIHKNNYDVRLSTLPTLYGESVVMRLLNQTADLLSLEKIGMPENTLLTLRKYMNLPNGLILLTGPTGSGKTTTLYSMLSELNKEDTKIITVEDPIEYRLPRITQVQIQPKIDLTFPRVLRACLRQDPDIIMVGELRDHETAEIAVRAAMTGHLVLSTLHTNDAVSSIVRLLDMGIEGYLIASVLRTVIAQRLVRCICRNCSVDYQLSAQEEMWLKSVVGQKFAGAVFKQGAGCAYCHQSGFKGQAALFELLEFTVPLANAMRVKNTNEFIKIVKEDVDFNPLVVSGLELAYAGLTTVSEIMRVIGEPEPDIIERKVSQ